MQLHILSEAQAVEGLESEHGLSFLLDVDGKKILFDTGASGLFARNAQKMGLSLADVDEVVLSHGHWDHGNGLQYMEGRPLCCHPGCFDWRSRKDGVSTLGLAMSREEIAEKFDVRTSDKALKISEHCWFLGEVPRLNDFEARKTKYQLEDGQEDFIMDDSGLACVCEDGLVLVSGCAHSGICNMLEHARKVTGIHEVLAIVGGFHLKAMNRQVQITVECLREARVQQLYPSHCTADPALSFFREELGALEVRAGTTLEF